MVMLLSKSGIKVTGWLYLALYVALRGENNPLMYTRIHIKTNFYWHTQIQSTFAILKSIKTTNQENIWL